MLSTRTAAVTLATAALVLTGGAATAASKTKADPVGDAPSAATDITRVVVRNDAKTLTVHTKLARASSARTHLVITLTPAAEGAATYVVRTGETAGRVGATLESTAVGATEATALECAVKAAVSKGRRGQVHVRVPQACFGADAGTLVASVATQTTEQAGTDVEQPPAAEVPTEEVADEAAPLRVQQG